MKVLFFIVFLFASSCYHQSSSSERLSSFKWQKEGKKKVVIFYNKSGGAHVSTTKAIKQALESSYEFVSINFSEMYFDRGDFFYWISNGKLGTDFWYNYFLKTGEIKILNFLRKNIVPTHLRSKYKEIIKKLKEDLSYLNPDLVISTIPLVNGYIGEVSESLSKPLIITSLDTDPKNWVFGLGGFKYDKFIFTTSIYSDYSKKKLINLGLNEKNIKIIPYPIRESFLEKLSRDRERKNLGIKGETFTIMILIGGSGGSKILDYVKLITHKFPDIHIVACIGGNKSLKKELRKFEKGKNISVIGFTDKIPQIMKASDLIITKPGPTTIIEAIVSDLPILVDGLSDLQSHEKKHVEFVKEKGYGLEFKSKKELISQIESLSKKEDSYKKIKNRLKKDQSKKFKTEFKKLVDDFL